MASPLYDAASSLTMDAAARAPRVDRARTFAQGLADRAETIDRAGEIPPDVVSAIDADDLWSDGPQAATAVLEELAVGSASVAARAALGDSDGAPRLSGLRGVGVVAAPTDLQRLGMAAVCVGIGRAAVQSAVAAIKARGERPSGRPSEPPHWVLADAATEVEAARLLVQQATEDSQHWSAAALVFAAGAARRAVDAAIRNAGPDAAAPGSVLDRLARDAQSAQNILGTEDDSRRAAADALLSDGEG